MMPRFNMSVDGAFGITRGRHFVREIAIGNFGVALLTTLWGYTTYKYNWLNVGGGTGDVDFWDAMRETMPIVAMLAWVAVILGAAMLFCSTGTSGKLRLVALLVSVANGPVTLFVSAWYFHRGFPLSPV